MNGTTCAAVTAVTNCATYDKSVAQKCLKCWGNTNKTIDNTCTAGSISNCATYTDKLTCATCKSGYFRNANNTCEAITEVANCATYTDKTNCNTCKVGFLKDSNKCEGFAICEALSVKTKCTALSNCSELMTDGLKCKRCVSTHALLSDGTCGKRSNTSSCTNGLNLLTNSTDANACVCAPVKEAGKTTRCPAWGLSSQSDWETNVKAEKAQIMVDSLGVCTEPKKDDTSSTTTKVEDCKIVDGSAENTVKCKCGSKECAANSKCTSKDNLCVTKAYGYTFGIITLILGILLY